jgi:4'-phosphopantetheinyl transferase
MTLRWHLARAEEVPTDDQWLTDEERAVLARLAVAKRREDWRLGRWTAKSLLGAVLGVPPGRVEVRAAGDGAPDGFVDGEPVGLSLSLSHRDGTAVAAVAASPAKVGIDLELLETRSDAFVREWLSAGEQAGLPSAGKARDLRVLCCWTGKEASAKALREGLRLDVRHAIVVPGPAAPGWVSLRVTWPRDGIDHRGWWRHDDRAVIAVVSDPPTGPPSRVTAR